MSEVQVREVMLVGLGHVARTRHARALDSLRDRCRVVAVCEPLDAAYTAFVSAFPMWSDVTTCPRYVSFDAALATHDLRDALVVLMTPSGLHASQAIAAMRAGAHVLVDKPMALTLSDARRMLEVSESTTRHLVVGYQQRHDPWLRALITHAGPTKRALGHVHHMSVQLFWNRDQAYFDGAPWRGTRQLDGGLLYNQANHLLDVIAQVCGEDGLPDEVNYMGDRLARDIQTHDSVHVTLRWRGRRVVTLDASLLNDPAAQRTTITVMGASGTLILGGARARDLLHGPPSITSLWPSPDIDSPDPHVMLYTRLFGTLDDPSAWSARAVTRRRAATLYVPAVLSALERAREAGATVEVSV